MPVEDVLHLGGIDVHPRRFDHPLLAEFEVEEAVGVHRSDVSGVKPDFAVLMRPERIGRLLRLVEVAQHDRGAVNADLSLLTDRGLFRRPRPHDLGHHVGERYPDASLAVLVERRGHDRRHGFGEPVALQELDIPAPLPYNRFEPLLDRAGKGVGAAEGGPEAAQVGLLKDRVAAERLEQRRYADDEIRPLLLDQIGNDLRRELRNEDALSPAHERGVDADPKAETVEDRQDRQDRIPSAQTAPHGDLHPLADEIVVGKHDPLRDACRSAAEQNDGHFVRAHVRFRRGRVDPPHEVLPPDDQPVLGHRRDFPPLGQVEADPLDEGQVIGDPAEDQRLEIRLPLNLFELSEKGVEGQRKAAFGGVQVKFDLLGRRQRVNHAGHRA